MMAAAAAVTAAAAAAATESLTVTFLTRRIELDLNRDSDATARASHSG
jgi:hypothetical protein